jgi:hypothetical protein
LFIDAAPEYTMSARPLRPDEVPNPQIRAHARQIADAALFLFKNRHKVNCVPSVLLESALAIELYLKSLKATTHHQPLEGTPGNLLTARYSGRKCHELTRLYDEIDQPIRDTLDVAYAKSQSDKTDASLRGALAPYDTLFVDVRYIFECRDPGVCDITDLVSLLQFLMETIDGVPPS